MNLIKWLRPGMGVKRWVIMFMFGVILLALGIAYILVELYRQGDFPDWTYYATLQFVPRAIRGVLFMGLAVFCIVFSVRKIGGSIVGPLLKEDDNLVDLIHAQRFLPKGPRIVCIGGGTGLSTLLRGLKEHTANLTAIVTVADDGGSSGRLRRDLSMPPPGDLRQCIAALAEAEPQMTRLFQYRFEEGDLKGHSFGNLFIAAMMGVHDGNFERAVADTSRILAVRGQILPSTLEDLTLRARFDDNTDVVGESSISSAGKSIEQVSIEPARAAAYPEAVRAIFEADLIVVGPGSLYTSVLPNLLVDDIAAAVRLSSALKMYVCNVATEKGETENFKVTDHVQALARHVGGNLFDLVLANNRFLDQTKSQRPIKPVAFNGTRLPTGAYQLVEHDVVDEANPLRHDPAKLSAAILTTYQVWRSNRSNHREPDPTNPTAPLNQEKARATNPAAD